MAEINQNELKNGENAAGINGDEILSCLFCKFILQEPRLLPCGHTFCLKCIKKKVTESCNGSLECLHCSKTHTLSDKDVDKLLPNKNIDKIVSEYWEIRKKKDTAKLCEDHVDLKAILYCMDCKAYICGECVSDGAIHQEHATKLAKEVIKAKKDKIDQMRINLREKLLPDALQLKNAANEQLQEYRNLRRELQEVVDERYTAIFNQFVQELEVQRAQVLESMKEKISEVSEPYQLAQNKAESQIRSINAVSEFMDGTGNNTHPDIMGGEEDFLAKLVENGSKVTLPQEPMMVHFEPGQLKLDGIKKKNWLGSFSSSNKKLSQKDIVLGEVKELFSKVST